VGGVASKQQKRPAAASGTRTEQLAQHIYPSLHHCALLLYCLLTFTVLFCRVLCIADGSGFERVKILAPGAEDEADGDAAVKEEQ
jgi:hypothetical protein